MYSLHTKKESAHNDSIWCCDWRQIKQVSETPEGIPGEDRTFVRGIRRTMCIER